METFPQKKERVLFPVELRRVQYLIRWLIWVVALGLVAALLEPIPILQPYTFVAWIVFAMVYKVAAMDIPRMKHAGLSPWLLLLLLVPVANLAIILLLFVAPQKK